MLSNYDYITLDEFFSPALADGLSLDSEWQQVSSGLQDSSQYSGWSQKCCTLDSLGSSSDSNSSRPLTKPLGIVLSTTITFGITITFISHSVIIITPWEFFLKSVLPFRGVWVTASLFKSPRTLLSILADLNNAIVWMVFTRPIISKSSSPRINPLVTLPKASFAIGIIVTLTSHNFFSSLVRSRYLSFFSLFFQFYSMVSLTAKSTIRQVLLLLLIIIRSGCLPEIFQDRCLVVHIPFVRMVKFQFLAQLPGDHIAHSVMSHLF